MPLPLSFEGTVFSFLLYQVLVLTIWLFEKNQACVFLLNCYLRTKNRGDHGVFLFSSKTRQTFAFSFRNYNAIE